MGGTISLARGARYEFKYLVTPGTASALRSHVATFLPPDRFTQDGSYAVSSLYLDSQDFSLYRQTLTGEKNRFKLRVRTYSDGAAAPAFLEVKRRVNAAILKRRAHVPREAAQLLLSGSVSWSAGLPASCRADASRFAALASLCRARPCVHVRYRREAYEPAASEPVRITFDTEIEYAPVRDTSLDTGGLHWKRTPVNGVVFEVKFSERYPTWVADLVRRFGLKNCSVPKYVLSLENALEWRRAKPTPAAHGRHLWERT